MREIFENNKVLKIKKVIYLLNTIGIQQQQKNIILSYLISSQKCNSRLGLRQTYRLMKMHPIGVAMHQ